MDQWQRECYKINNKNSGFFSFVSKEYDNTHLKIDDISTENEGQFSFANY